jgi:hypothetical protein
MHQLEKALSSAFFIGSNTDELSRFFTKTLGQTQTDCQRGGRSMHGGDGAHLVFSRAGYVASQLRPVIHVARCLYALFRRNYGCGDAGNHVAVFR